MEDEIGCGGGIDAVLIVATRDGDELGWLAVSEENWTEDTSEI